MEDVIFDDLKVLVIKNDIAIGKVDHLTINYNWDKINSTEQLPIEYRNYTITYDCENFTIDLKSISQYDKDCVFYAKGFGFEFDLYVTRIDIEVSKDFHIIRRNDDKIIKKEMSLNFAGPISKYVLNGDTFILESVNCSYKYGKIMEKE